MSPWERWPCPVGYSLLGSECPPLWGVSVPQAQQEYRHVHDPEECVQEGPPPPGWAMLLLRMPDADDRLQVIRKAPRPSGWSCELAQGHG